MVQAEATPESELPEAEEPVIAETEVVGVGMPQAASEETMKMVRASLTAHKRETDALRRTMNLGFDPEYKAESDEVGDEG